MDESTVGKSPPAAQDPATDRNDLSLPLPEPIVLAAAQTKVVAGGGCRGCGMMGPIRPPVSLA